VEPSAWAPDKLIPFGKYLLLDRISVGATSVLYRGRTLGEAGFERLVTVKRLLPHMVGDEDFVKTFVKEAKTAARLTHPNICPIFELGKVGESMYMTMEYIAGKDLGKIARKLRSLGEPYPPEVAAYVTSKLCDALDYANNLKNTDGEPIGIVHRDISPPNILLSYEGQVKLIDFGLAKAVGQAQQTSIEALKNKLSYMSPEMVKGGALDQRSDLFGLGVCLYEMITSRQLFEGNSDLATLKLVSAASIPPPSGFLEDVPEELEIIAMRALERDPEDRWQSAEELNVALQSYLVKEHPGYGARQLSEWLTSYFADEIKAEQDALNVLLEASRRPGIIEERRRFFTSPAGAAAIAKAEVIRRMNNTPSASNSTVDRDEGRLPVPPMPSDSPTTDLQALDDEIEELDDFEVLDDITPVRTVNVSDIGDESTHFYDKPLQEGDSNEDDPAFYLQAALADSSIYEEDATQIFFNKEEGVGLSDLFREIAPSDNTATPLLPPVGESVGEASSSAVVAQDKPAGRERLPTLQMQAPRTPFWRSLSRWIVVVGVGLLLAVIGAIIYLSLQKPAVGSIKIRTIPAVSASVLLDGVERGSVPMRMDSVPAGVHRLEIRAEGYKTVAQEVKLPRGVTVVFDILLTSTTAASPKRSQIGPSNGTLPQGAQPANTTPTAGIVAQDTSSTATIPPAITRQGTLSIDSDPWARVFLDQKDTGANTPMSMPVEQGDHLIGLQTPDGKMHIEKVTVNAGQTHAIVRSYGIKEQPGSSP
jgi:serine/threonine-protein kinase